MTQQKLLHQVTPTPPLTPIQQLQAEKQRIKAQCDQQVKDLNKDFLHIQENAGSLLLSGLSGLLFSKKKNSETPEQTTAIVPVCENRTANVSFSDYLSLIPKFIPVIWEVGKPIITAWGMKKMRHWITKRFFGKNKEKTNN